MPVSAVTPNPSSGAALGDAAASTSVDVLLGNGDAGQNPTAGTPLHVLICLSGDSIDAELMRQGRVLAGWLGARLTALYAFRLGESPASRPALARDRQYARSIGTPLVELPAYSPVEAIAEFARTRSVTHIVLVEDRPAGRLHSLVSVLLERLTGLDLYVVSPRAGGQHSEAV
jgi:K+-sensing histidine kinase KdpD